MYIAKRRQRTIVLERRSRVAALYLAGMPQWEIAEKCQVADSQVSRDLTALRAAWRESAGTDIGAWIAKELAAIDNLERTYWLAWDRRCGQREITSTKRKGEGQEAALEASLRKEGRDGNPEFLRGAMSCIERRCKLLGLDAPKKNEHTGKDGGPIEFVEPMNEDERARRITEILDAAGAGQATEAAKGGEGNAACARDATVPRSGSIAGAG
jgi:hypothetical protein